jgi:hypothetical protein
LCCPHPHEVIHQPERPGRETKVCGPEVFHRPLAAPLGGGDVDVVVGRWHPPGHTARGRACTTNLLTLSRRIHSLWLGGVVLDPAAWPFHPMQAPLRPHEALLREAFLRWHAEGAGTLLVRKTIPRQGAAAGRPRPPSVQITPDTGPVLADHQVEALIDYLGPRKGPVESQAAVRNGPLCDSRRSPATNPSVGVQKSCPKATSHGRWIHRILRPSSLWDIDSATLASADQFRHAKRALITGAIKWGDANFAFPQVRRLRRHTLWPPP